MVNEKLRFRLRLALWVITGLVVIAVLVAGVFYIQRGAHLELKGRILKVRTLATDENSSVAIIDFRITNVADYPWVVRSVNVSITDADGFLVEGSTVADSDVTRLFDYFPLLGQKYNDSLIIRTRVPPRQTLDRMIGARFEIPENKLAHRKDLVIRIEEVDGAASEIREGGAH